MLFILRVSSPKHDVSYDNVADGVTEALPSDH